MTGQVWPMKNTIRFDYAKIGINGDVGASRINLMCNEFTLEYKINAFSCFSYQPQVKSNQNFILKLSQMHFLVKLERE